MPYPIPFDEPLHLAVDAARAFGGYDHPTDHPGASPLTGDPGPGTVRVGQVYVHSRVPVDVTGPPIVMIHGSNRTGATFETTPDGREGWATWFIRRGHPVHVVDHAGRGRSGFDPTGINAVRAGATGVEAPNVFLGTTARAWVNARIGPRYPEPFPNVRFPLESFETMVDRAVPNAETTLEHGSEHTIDGVIDLLDEIGPAVLLVHSQGGLYGIEITCRRPDLVMALVSVEGACHTITPEVATASFHEVPLLSVWGDNSSGAEGANGDRRRTGCIEAVANVTASGGTATFLLLPDVGIHGNSHLLMMDDNNLDVAALIGAWLDDAIGPA
jgi:pimeloyl-ACP methyl ester carboxylesterase